MLPLRKLILLAKPGLWSWCGIKLHNSAADLPCNHCLDSNACGVVSYRVELLVDDENNYATFLVLNNEMLNLTKQAAATALNDEVSRGVCNKVPPLLAALENRVFLFHVLLTANNTSTNSPPFTVLGISDTTNPADTLTDEVEGGECKLPSE
ncbi:hypothetical protein Rs2_18666 [Raphanus sativus]|nr:hypothetical protein Rs2_18666 [Raphanus sativus]